MTTTTATTTTTFTPLEQEVLQALRARYHQDHDLFSDSELEQLRFVRWLYQTGRLSS
jgi:hypothetical protein